MPPTPLNSDNPPPPPRRLPVAHYFIAGGVGDVCACIFSHPFDTLKVRQQLTGELQRSPSGFHGQSISRMIQTSRVMFAHEGIFGFYRGLSSSILRQSTFSTMRHGGFATLCAALATTQPGVSMPPDARTEDLPPHPSKHIKLPQVILVGAIVGSASAFFTNPTDICLVRMQSDGHWPIHQRRGYRHVGDALVKIVRHEGIKRLWRGCGPTVVRAACVTTSQVPTYFSTKRFILRKVPAWFQNGANDTKLHIIASVNSALVASVVTCPLDVIKTRMMNMNSSHGTYYAGALDCVFRTVKTEGMSGLFKGLLPTFLRLGPHTLVLWNVQELVLRKLNVMTHGVTVC